MSFLIKTATRENCPLILTFIKELAEYEQMAEQVEATVEGLEHWLFDQQQATVWLLEEDQIPVGFALFFTNFSTFKGKPGLYLEDLFIREASRHKGYGKQVFDALQHKAKTEGYGRVEWVCLDWNQPSLAFYQKLGAATMDEWIIHRLNISEK